MSWRRVCNRAMLTAPAVKAQGCQHDALAEVGTVWIITTGIAILIGSYSIVAGCLVLEATSTATRRATPSTASRSLARAQCGDHARKV